MKDCLVSLSRNAITVKHLCGKILIEGGLSLTISYIPLMYVWFTGPIEFEECDTSKIPMPDPEKKKKKRKKKTTKKDKNGSPG